MAQWQCDVSVGVNSCRVATCETDYSDCGDAGTACGTNLQDDADNCGSCGAAVTPEIGDRCAGGAPRCGQEASCEVDAGVVCAPEDGDAGVGAVCCLASEANCAGVCTNVLTELATCGGCNNDWTGSPSANACVGGMPVCGSSGEACPSTAPFCLPDTGSECFECLVDGDCAASPNGAVCCGGSCVPRSLACGCSSVPGTMTSACDPAGIGGACVAANGAVLTDSSPPIDFHQGACGCAPANGEPVPETSTCGAVNGLLDLCAPSSSSGAIGMCTPQNDPVRVGTAGAQNCGFLGNTCDVFKGGYACYPSPTGAGECGCDTAAAASDGCAVALPGVGSRNHRVADRCFNGKCDCTNETGVAVCDPTSITEPDCCPGGCTDLQTDVNNCGACGTRVAANPGSSTCLDGVLRCGTAAVCASPTPYCVQTAPGAVGCVQCRSDTDCTGGTPVCCGGQCVGVASACGCESAVGGRAGAVCDAGGTGGACVNKTTGAIIAVNGAFRPNHTRTELHDGACGCAPPDGEPSNTLCTPVNNLADLCVANPSAGQAGQCVPQDSYNCGGQGDVCNASRGGLECKAGPTLGAGVCGCTPDTGGFQDPDRCRGGVADGSGKLHTVARSCESGRCACYFSYSANSWVSCSPTGSTPDCCPLASSNECTNLQTDPNNCGKCGAVCPSGQCVGGICTCSNATHCGTSVPGGDTCIVNANGGRCACSTSGNLSCQDGAPCTINCGCCAGACTKIGANYYCSVY